MAEYRLYRPNDSGNAYKATLMPNLCGLDWEPVFIEFFFGDKRTERYLFEINELGENPGIGA
jgi:glutathione S-transferase